MQAIDGRTGPVQETGYRIEVLPAQPELAGSVHLRVAGQDLFDQGRSRAGQAEDEDRATRVEPRAGESREVARLDCGDHLGDETLVLGRLEGVMTTLQVGEGQGVGQSQALGGFVVFAAFVQYMSQSEEQ